ncbi:MAG: single-stranded-DNA-specific exonuclease RecJ [Gammaproteobacteria bacterium]|nr:single-stranded-DNA-specific exonuclease RecJ [Gammaproteobacteria bacterium]MDH5591969.1 single-stranded-DNA-specific exonuclease RecJ [Gammaproteobacteria bacterium]
MIITERDNTGWQQLPDNWPDCLRKVLAARGITAEQDLTFPLSELPKPDLLLGMDKAVELLHKALTEQWKITIVADFDTDGATSCAVAIRGLTAMGVQHIDYIVPNRFVHGYGLTPALLDDIPVKNQPELLITVDNGIASVAGVEEAHKRGIKVLVTDHHLPGDSLPDAEAIINPNQHGDEFPSKNMAGVGVCFYLLLGLRQYLRQQGWFEQQHIPEPKLVDLLDLVALGTVADVVPLDRLNRTLVTMGLARIRKALACAGIKALIQVAGKQTSQLATTDLGFSVAPRLNAAGRMEDMGLGINTLLTDDIDEALMAAQLLDNINLERRSVEKEMQNHALQMLEAMSFDVDDQPLAYCLYDPNWHQGVVGLLASRIKERQHRPVIAFAPGDDGEIKGSARSIPGIHIRDILALVASQKPELLTRFGGHAMAAGLTLKQDDLAEFEQCFLTALQSQVGPEVLQQTLNSDGEIDVNDMSLTIADLLPTAAPWGQGFPEPQFHGHFVVDNIRTVGQEGDHLRLTLRLSNGKTIVAMAFRQQQPDWLKQGDEVLIVYRLSANEFRNQRSVQLLVEKLLRT